jgi:hypothetical protein
MTSARAAGLLVTAQNLRKKLAELKKREKEVENNKGFSASGVSKKVSVEDEKEDLGAQEAMISELLGETDLAQLREQQEEQKEKDLGEDEAAVSRNLSSLGEAMSLAKVVKDNLEQKGFSCAISTRGDNVTLEINSGPEVPSVDFLESAVADGEENLSHGHAAEVLAKRALRDSLREVIR